MHKVHNIIQVLRETLLATKGATVQIKKQTIFVFVFFLLLSLNRLIQQMMVV